MRYYLNRPGLLLVDEGGIKFDDVFAFELVMP
jgi:hypothetical protein